MSCGTTHACIVEAHGDLLPIPAKPVEGTLNVNVDDRCAPGRHDVQRRSHAGVDHVGAVTNVVVVTMMIWVANTAAWTDRW
ncbi:hypothetical protein TUM20983_20420 [Mycobacterium antarcticum]|uniref:hypothetical protein n=1 Tax=Mycolicibacterium sp. TUM20983 TaxID=3023369 RepID=UPI002385643F|nr:hypothetical protein [Mycolicibacterium sp. TUM20983]GLP74932.1 hypothetical protein TUM20983_20420 [Mycolicibacterium sp. TUM20983]